MAHAFPPRTQLSPERQSMLDDALAQIAAAFPPRPSVADLFLRAIERGEPVLIITADRAASFNQEISERDAA